MNSQNQYEPKDYTEDSVSLVDDNRENFMIDQLLNGPMNAPFQSFQRNNLEKKKKVVKIVRVEHSSSDASEDEIS